MFKLFKYQQIVVDNVYKWSGIYATVLIYKGTCKIVYVISTAQRSFHKHSKNQRKEKSRKFMDDPPLTLIEVKTSVKIFQKI